MCAISNSVRHFSYVEGQMDGMNSSCIAMQKHASPTAKEQKLRDNTSFSLHPPTFGGQ
jgi:hypothetical protein